MSFSDDFLDEIRSRVGLADLIGRQTRLIRRGREFVACCPFHQEKTPSFTINEQKGFYHCFGCGAHGTIFDFVMQTERVSFPEAVERLAGQAGLAVPRSDPADADRARRRQSLFEVLDHAASHYQRNLRMPEGKPALDYLRGRGLDEGAIARFRLGFALPGRSALKAALARDGIAETLMLEAGLLIQPEDGDGGSFDRFRGRVMFPIGDRRGRVVGFGGRILGPGEPKYLNSPETPLFHKGRLLYGQPAAAEAARRTGRLIVVEGYMDVIGLALAGYEETVAPLGTALTEEQLQELWRLVPEPILCFDPDAAGRRAAARACERALPLLRPGLGLRFAFLPSETGDDPDTFVKRYPSRKHFDACLKAAIPLSEWLARLIYGGLSPDNPESSATIVDKIMQLINKIPDPTIRVNFFAHVRDVVRRFERAKNPVYTKSKRREVCPPPPVTLRPGDERPSPLSGYDAERTLLGILYWHPAFFDEVEEEIGTLAFTSKEHDQLRQAIITILSGAKEKTEDVENKLRDMGVGDILNSVLNDAIIASHQFISKDASLGAIRATWRQNVDLLRRCAEAAENALGDTVPTIEAAQKRTTEKAAAFKVPTVDVSNFDLGMGRGSKSGRTVDDFVEKWVPKKSELS